MNIFTRLIALFIIGLPLLACTANEDPQHSSHETEAPAPMGEKQFEGQIAPILEGMGAHGFALSAGSDTANQFFNQALALTYGFNHLEAGRSYQQVAALEPNAAIAHWGQALVLGPNINGAMESASVKPAFDAIQKALALQAHASDKEKGLIQALSTRYSRDESLADRSTLDEAYAQSMRTLVARYPEDPNIRTLLAEALMVIHAWDYWMGDGRPKEWTPEILEVLETGLERHPKHAGLIHYYIHAVEASKDPGRALAGADMLRNLVPGAGHLVHMPSHIYIRTGRYQDGVEANEKAIVVDNNYIAQCRQQGIYPVAYVPHNRHFLWAMASMQGNSKKAIAAAEHMAQHIDVQLMRESGYGTLQHYWVTPSYAHVRFGQWDKVLETVKPDSDLIYPLGVWHYARGIALTAKGELESAQEELKQLQTIAANEALKNVTVWEINNAYDVMTIASLVLHGELSAKAQRFDEAIVALRKAAALEDSLNYNEPSDWHYPVRQSLGAVLLEAKNFAEAEKAYREDLEVFPENGWSLYGLSLALRGQGKETEADAVHERFKSAWTRADISLSSSRVL